MSRSTNFTDNVTPVSADWLNDSQEIDTGLSWGARLRLDSTNQITLYGDSLTEGAYALRVGARARYGASTVSATASGGSASLNVYATSADVASPKAPAVALSATAPATAFYRKIGETTWSGSAITSLRLLNGVQANADQYNAFVLRPLVTSDVPLTVEGLASQSANLVNVRLSTGTSVFAVSPNSVAIGAGATNGVTFDNGTSLATSTGSYSGTAALTVRAQTLEVGKTGGRSELKLYKPDGTAATLSVNNSNQLVITT
jgi:hypothetical protein